MKETDLFAASDAGGVAGSELAEEDLREGRDRRDRRRRAFRPSSIPS